MDTKYYDFPFYTEKECDDFCDYFSVTDNEFMKLNAEFLTEVRCVEYEILNQNKTKKIFDEYGESESTVKVNHPLLESTTYNLEYHQVGIYYTGDADFSVIVRFKDRPASAVLRCSERTHAGAQRHYEMLTGRDLDADRKTIDIIGTDLFDKHKETLTEIEKAHPGISQFLTKSD